MKKQRDKKQFLKLCSKILRIGIAMTAAMSLSVSAAGLDVGFDTYKGEPPGGWTAKSFASWKDDGTYANVTAVNTNTSRGTAMKIQTEKFKPDGAEYQLYESFGFYRDPFITIETSPIKISTEFYIDDWGTQYVDSVDSTKSSNSEVYFAVATGLQNKVAPAFGLRIIGGNLIYMFDGGWSATTEIQNININAGEWHRLDYMYYPIDPNGTLNPDGTPKYPKGIVYYYIDGVKVAENPQSTFSVGDYLGNIAFYGRSTCIDAEDSEKGNTSVVFDNFYVNAAEDNPGEFTERFKLNPNTKTLTAQWKNRVCAQIDDSDIKIEKFNENDKMMLNPTELIKDTDYIINDRTPCSVTVELKNAAQYGEQYRISTPIMQDAFGTGFKYNAEYAIYDGDGAERTTVFSTDFENYVTTREQASSSSVPSGFANSKKYAGSDSYIFYSGEDSEHGRYAIMETTADSAAYGGMHRGSGISEIADAAEISFDFYFGDLKGTNAQHSIWSGIVQGGTTSCNWRFGARIFHSSNQTTSNGKSAENNANSAWNDLENITRNASGWNTFKMVYRKASNDVLYYMNNKPMNKDGTAVPADSSLNQTALGNLVLGGGSASSGAIVGYDNVVLSNVNYVKKIRYIDFADAKGNILPSKAGKIPAGTVKILIGTDGIGDLDSTKVELKSDESNIGFTGTFNGGVYEMSLDNMIDENKNLTLKITDTLDEEYNANFSSGNGEIKTSDFCLKNDDGTVKRIPESGSVHSSVKVSNSTSVPKSVYIVTACYKGQRLEKIEIQSPVIGAAENKEASGAEIKNAAQYDAISTFVWSDIAVAKPMLKSVNITK